MGRARLNGQNGSQKLTGDATVNNVAIGKTFYSNDAKTKLTGTGANAKRWASGTVNSYFGTVEGLEFTPKLVIMQAIYSFHVLTMTYNGYGSYASMGSKYLSSFPIAGGDAGSFSYDSGRGISINTGGFTYGHSQFYNTPSISWKAFE